MCYNHKEEMMKCARDLQLLFETDIGCLDVAKSVSDFDESQRKENNPLAQGLPLYSKNIFVDVIRFGLKENKDLIHFILKHTAGNRSEFDESVVRHIAKVYIQMGSKINRNNNTFKKLQGVFLQLDRL